MRRPRKEVNVFNISMLDVISSALGAILILFLITMQAEMKAKSSSQDCQQRQQELEEKIQKVQEENLKIQKENEEIQKELEKTKIPMGAVIGMCDVNISTVIIGFKDHGQVDGDRAKIMLDKKVLEEDLYLKSEYREYVVTLEPGANYIIVEALDEGSVAPNTANVRITPCYQGKPRVFLWEMFNGELRNVSIVYENSNE